MRRSKRSVRLLTGTTLAAGVLFAPVIALASPASSSRPEVPIAARAMVPTAVTARHSRAFRIRIGHIYDIHSRLYGIRRHDRLGVRVHNLRKHRWYRLGSYRLHRGQRRFRGRAFAAYQGLFHLQLFILRHHRVVRHSYSNVFRVRVLPRRHRIRRPRNALTNVAALMANSDSTNARSSGWTDILCGSEGFSGQRGGPQNKVFVNPPINYANANTLELINVVAWSRDAYPGGNYGSWYIAANYEQQVWPKGYNQTPYGTWSLLIDDGTPGPSEQIDSLEIAYGSVYDEYHQIAWDMQVYTNSGWQWLWPNQWITPDSYTQEARDTVNGQGPNFDSPYCLTYKYPG